MTGNEVEGSWIRPGREKSVYQLLSLLWPSRHDGHLFDSPCSETCLSGQKCTHLSPCERVWGDILFPWSWKQKSEPLWCISVVIISVETQQLRSKAKRTNSYVRYRLSYVKVWKTLELDTPSTFAPTQHPPPLLLFIIDDRHVETQWIAIIFIVLTSRLASLKRWD